MLDIFCHTGRRHRGGQPIPGTSILINTDDMRERLLKLRDKLQTMVDTGDQASEVVELDQGRSGRLTRMDAMQAQAMAQAFGQRRQFMLRRVAAALERLENSDFGKCQSCEKSINPKRLEFDPTAVLCIECAEKAEH